MHTRRLVGQSLCCSRGGHNPRLVAINRIESTTEARNTPLRTPGRRRSRLVHEADPQLLAQPVVPICAASSGEAQWLSHHTQERPSPFTEVGTKSLTWRVGDSHLACNLAGQPSLGHGFWFLSARFGTWAIASTSTGLDMGLGSSPPWPLPCRP